MQKTIAIASIILVGLMAGANAAPNVPEIDIKGIKIGMEKSSVEAITGTVGSAKRRKFTIGGVGTGDGFTPSASYESGKLISFFFRFEPDQFDAVRDAVKAKYPSIRCSQKVLQNGFGAKFIQDECTLESDVGHLWLRRYAEKVTDGYLMLITKVDPKKSQAEKKTRTADI